MAEPEPNPAPDTRPKHRGWARSRLYLWSILLAISLWLCGSIYTIRFNPARFVDALRNQLPFPSSRGDVYWLNPRTLKIDRVTLGSFFYADSIVVTATPWGIFTRHIAKIEIAGPQVFTAPLGELMDAPTTGKPMDFDWVIGRLEISHGTVLLQDMAPGLGAIPIRIGVKSPVALNNIRLGKPDNSPDMIREQKMDIENINIISPYDPLVKVLGFPLIRVRFTYQELWHHRIRQVDLIKPTIYLGQDLFAFGNQIRNAKPITPQTGAEDPWQVSRFNVEFGQLALNAYGETALQFPFFFKTEVNDIRLDQLDRISAKAKIPIIRFDHVYPEYKVQIVNLSGNLNFKLPLSDKRANNVVPTVHMDMVSWNEIPLTDAWMSVTLDPSGMFGKLGGTCEGGYVKGNFELYYNKGAIWNADLFAENIDSKPVAQKLVGKYFNLTGHLQGKVSIQGQGIEILDCHGLLELPKPGVMEITSLDQFLKDLPPELALKTEFIKLAVKSFRTYPYEKGQVKVAYTPTGGKGTLLLTSPLGKRQFDMYWHPSPEPDSSKVAKDADNR